MGIRGVTQEVGTIEEIIETADVLASGNAGTSALRAVISAQSGHRRKTKAASNFLQRSSKNSTSE
jgi:hypothetical protein